MALIKIKTNISRSSIGTVKVVKNDLHKGKPHKALLKKNQKLVVVIIMVVLLHVIVVVVIKQHYRIIDFKRNKDGYSC